MNKRIRHFILFTFTCFACIFLVSACSQVSNVQTMKSNNSNFRVKSLIMHFTAVDYATSVRLLVDEGGLSAHYLIPQSNDPTYPHDKLEVLQLVDENERAWHAGVSHWQGRNSLNDSSIGIEIVNVPYCEDLAESPKTIPALYGTNTIDPLCIYPDFDPAQIQLLITLSQEILARNPDITPTAIIGHSDIAPARKHDPGPRFPWFELYKNGVGAWYDNDTISRYWQIFTAVPLSVKLLQEALGQYGYDLTASGKMDQLSIDTIEAFQMHFLPWQVNGQADAKTSAAIFALLEKYFPERAQRLFAAYELEAQSRVNASVPIATIGQFDKTFSGSAFTENSSEVKRASFFAYKNTGLIRISSDEPTSIELKINKAKLNIAERLEANKEYEYSISKRTIDGVNALLLSNIDNADANVRISIDYPVLKDSSTLWESKFNNLTSLATDTLHKQYVQGGMLVAHKGHIINRHVWGKSPRIDTQNRSNSTDMSTTTDTLFDIGRLTSAFVSTLAIMQLAEQGSIDIDNAVSTYLPEYTRQKRDSITIKDLLSQATDYPKDISFFAPEKTLSPDLFSRNKTHTEYLLTQRVPLLLANDGHQTHNNINFMLLGMVIERVTGLDLDEYARTRLFSGMGLTNTLFNPISKDEGLRHIAFSKIDDEANLDDSFALDNVNDEHVQQHDRRQSPVHGQVLDDNAYYAMQGVSGHAGLFSSIDDLSVVAQSMLNKGGYGQKHIFSHSLYTRFLAPTHTKSAFGLGWQLFGHEGDRISDYASYAAFGYRDTGGSIVLIDPVHELFIVMLTGASFDANDGNKQDTVNIGALDEVVSLIYETVLHAKS